jgi:hypothetical protein
VRFTDASISGVCSDTIIMDIVQPPAGLSISINAGAACADSSTVTLTLAATGADEMRFRNESGAWSPWEDFAASKVWTLSPGRGSKTVGFQCRNLCASQSAEVTDTIRLRVFDDVPCGHSQRPYVEALVREGITSGCSVSPPLYCPLSSVTRAQMAVFIIRAMDETPYSNPTPTFTDVPAGHWAYGCIERMYQLGITGGCSTSPMRYCPDAPVNRSQMAVFLCRAAGKGPLTPGTPTFADVLPSASFYGYVERLADPVSWGGTAVTGGCTVNPKRYCPYDAVTRGQMAVFLCRAFSIGL